MIISTLMTQTTVFLHVASYIIPFLDIFIPKVGLNRWVLLARLSAVTLAQSEHKGGKGISIAHTLLAQKCQPATHIAASVLFHRLASLICIAASSLNQSREEKASQRTRIGCRRLLVTFVHLEELQEVQGVAGHLQVGHLHPPGTWRGLLGVAGQVTYRFVGQLGFTAG